MSLEIGLRLKQAREAMGLSIQDIRDKTRIESRYLIAIENGEFEKLPSPYFVRTSIRAYAKCVGIEPHHLLKKYRPVSGESGAAEPDGSRNSGRQKAVHEERSRFSTTSSRLPSRESVESSTPERVRQTGPHGIPQRTMRLSTNPLSGKTDPNIGSGSPSGDAAGDADQTGTSSRWSDRLSETVSIAEKREGTLRRTERLSAHSRRAARSREHRFSRRWAGWVAVAAGVVLLIPITWAAVSFLKGDSPAERPNRSAAAGEQSGPGSVNAEPPAPSEAAPPEEDGGKITLVEDGGGIAHYQASGMGELLVEIGPVTDTCWLQIREQRESGKYLKDVTLKANESFQYRHPENGSPELWISFGAPHTVKQIKVNGQSIRPSKVIHIERVNGEVR